jgi:16S rRNA (cytosine967-C5)-methyltransferase
VRIGSFSSDTFQVAETVIRKANRQRPADALLRQELRARSNLLPQDAAAISALVFGFYRWFGWLDARAPLQKQLAQAEECSERFRQNPMNFPDAELLERAIPEWIKTEVEVSAEWARSLQSEPILWLRARPGRGEALAAKLGNAQVFGEASFAEIVRYHGAEDLFRTPEFHAGEFEIQDINSQAVGLVCGPDSGQTWWDACAGEGGKTLHLSDLMQNKGLIWATDVAEWRLKNLRRRAARAGVFNFRARAWDGGPKLPFKTKFDGVLVDAPCSGVGTWGRNPHARWTLGEQDVRELAALQVRLLRHVAPAVKAGGKLVYAVCTVTRAETLRVAEEFERDSGFVRAQIADPFGTADELQDSLFLGPQVNGGNGMFVAVWRKTH